MTMPKFEPVAFVQSDPNGHLHLAKITKTEACQTLDQWDRQCGWKAVPLHTADQLTEAYEAGKREASEDIEQAAFEKWLYDKCPSGDVESVQRQWLESYEYAELAGKMEQAAQIEMMRQQLAAAHAACKMKDAAIKDLLEFATYSTCGKAHAVEAAKEALAIQPDDAALKAWLGEPVARLIPVTLPDGDRVWARTFEEYSQESSKNNMYRNGPEIPLYSPKGLK